MKHFGYFSNFSSLSETPECDSDPWGQKGARGADSKALGWEGPPGVSYCFIAGGKRLSPAQGTFPEQGQPWLCHCPLSQTSQVGTRELEAAGAAQGYRELNSIKHEHGQKGLSGWFVW